MDGLKEEKCKYNPDFIENLGSMLVHAHSLPVCHVKKGGNEYSKNI